MANLVCVSILAVLLSSSLPTAAVEPPREPAHEFTFVVLGDSQFHLPNTFNRLIDEIVHLYPAFVIQVGDMISGYVDDPDEFRAQWRRFHAQIAPLDEIPFYPVPGNHDLLDASRKPGGEKIYREVWGNPYYSFGYRNAHFVILNTDAGKGREIAGEQLEWLEKDLAAAKMREHIFVFFHRPIYALKDREQLHQLFLRRGVSAVFYGHEHHLNYQQKDGIPYIMTTSATRLGTPFPLAAGSLHHLLLVTVRDNTFRIAVMKAGSILPVDIVSPEDNERLFHLERRFFTDKRIAFGKLKEVDNSYEVVLRVNNPSTQELAVFLEWQLPNERWVVEPLKGGRLSLPAGARDHAVTFRLRRRFPHPPEAFPSCVARTLYLTTDGDVVQSEHLFEIVAGEEAAQR